MIRLDRLANKRYPDITILTALERYRMNEEAKRVVVDIVMGAGVPGLRFRANTMQGFGVAFDATKVQYEKIEADLFEAGLTPDLHGVDESRESKMEPTYTYALFIYVPVGWKGQK